MPGSGAHDLYPRTQEAEAGSSLNSMLTCSTDDILRWPGIHKENPAGMEGITMIMHSKF